MYWKINNFKGLHESNINFSKGKISLLTGSNSSGKSSIIQSLLFFSQCWKDYGGTPLNGSLVRLGDPDDIFRTGHNELTITFGIEDNDELDFFKTYYFNHPREGELYRITLAPSPVNNDVIISKFEVIDSQNNTVIFKASTPKKKVRDVVFLEKKYSWVNANILRVDESKNENNESFNRTFIVFDGLVPISLVEYKNEDAWKSYIINGLKKELTESRKTTELRKNKSVRYSESLFDYVLDFCHSYHASEVDTFNKLGLNEKYFEQNITNSNQLLNYVYNLTESQQNIFFELISRRILEDSKFDGKSIMASLNILPWLHRINSIRSSTPIDDFYSSKIRTLHYNSSRSLEGYVMLSTALSTQIQYLGPLRDEPRVLWNVSGPKISGLPVGSKGEYSSSVLAKNANTLVEYFKVDSTHKSTKEKLSEAVNYWVEYLEIGESIGSESKGKLGTSLTVEVDGKVRDLTAVGVGVSQMLPVVIAMLTLPENSIFIVEQPELHLHPHVQSQLADFMITARPDVSLIIETHSESLVTRIRRRVLEEKVQPDNINIFFVEQKDSDLGRYSETSKLDLNHYGDLSRWPDGFLKGPQEDYVEILKLKGKKLREAVK